MSEDLHKNAVRALCSTIDDLKTKGFRKAIRQALLDCDDFGDASEVDFFMENEFKFVPDAYRIIEKAKIIETYEIEHTSWLDDIKLKKYADAWFALDSEGWLLLLYAGDVYTMALKSISLLDVWYNYLYKQNVKS